MKIIEELFSYAVNMKVDTNGQTYIHTDKTKRVLYFAKFYKVLNNKINTTNKSEVIDAIIYGG